MRAPVGHFLKLAHDRRLIHIKRPAGKGAHDRKQYWDVWSQGYCKQMPKRSTEVRSRIVIVRPYQQTTPGGRSEADGSELLEDTSKLQKGSSTQIALQGTLAQRARAS